MGHFTGSIYVSVPDEVEVWIFGRVDHCKPKWEMVSVRNEQGTLTDDFAVDWVTPLHHTIAITTSAGNDFLQFNTG
jgi:hypothetical protein